jgi:hypothetical protein
VNKTRPNTCRLAFQNLPKTLKILLFLAIFILLLYHFQQFCEQIEIYVLSLNPTLFSFTKTFSEFISKFAYAIITSTIFYFITQQLPKEKKRINVAQFVSNSFPFIQTPVRDLEFDIFNGNKEVVTMEDYNLAGNNIQLDQPVRDQLVDSMSWRQFILQTMHKIIVKIDEISQLNDLLDTNTFILLQKIKSDCLTVSNLLNLRSRSMQASSNLSYVASLLFSIRQNLVQFGELGEKFVMMYTGKAGFKSVL